MIRHFQTCALLLFFLTYGLSLNAQTVHKKKVRHKDKIEEVSSNQPIDALLERLEAAHITLNRINNPSNNAFNTDPIEQSLPRVERGLSAITKRLNKPGMVIDVNNLQMYDALLDNIQDKLDAWKDQLVVYDKELVKMNSDMKEFSGTRDSVLKKLAVDTSYRVLFQAEISGLKDKWVQAAATTKAHFNKINALQARISSSYFTTVELADRVDFLMSEFWTRTLGKEYPYIWEVKQTSPSIAEVNQVSSSFSGQIFRYYLFRTTGKYIILGVFVVLFFGLVFYLFQRFNHFNKVQKLEHEPFHFISSFPLLGTLTILFTCAPLLDLNTPSIYTAISQIILLIIIGLIFRRFWPKNLGIYWIMLGVLYVGFSLLDVIIDFNLFQRISLLILSAVSILFGILFFRKIRGNKIFEPFARFVLVVYILFNILAVSLNIFGRLSLADQFGMAAVYGLLEVFAYSAIIAIANEFFSLLDLYIRSKNKDLSRLQDPRIKTTIHSFLVLVMVIVWTITLLDNLNCFDYVSDQVTAFLTMSLAIGTMSFTPGSLVLFFFIIYLSNLFQRFVGFFLSDGDEMNPDFKKKSSRLAIVRLLLLLIGFLLAVAASGLPVDKITILLGALGVGIGLGLQNIVQNLVSGVVLIFERPFQIGDMIEIGTRKGRVKDIGIRSSKLITSEGTEIIVPNGDLLAERVVNWTFSNNNIRIEMSIKLAPGSDIDLAKSVISEELEKENSSLKHLPSEVFLDNITESTIDLKVLTWISDLHEEQSFRSTILRKIFARFQEKNIKMI